MKEENYILIAGWMVKQLNLKGNELLLYALIYGFCQDDNSAFTGSLQYMADWTNSSKQGVTNALKSLIDKGYIEKNEVFKNRVKFCEYRTTKLDGVSNKVDGGIQQSCIGGIQQSWMNNTSIDNSKNIPKDNTSNSYEEIKKAYNEICTSFPKVTVLSNARKKALHARLQTYTIEDFKKMFEMAEGSSFLKGENNRNWSANFDWMIKDANMAKILDGNYSGRGKATVQQERKYDQHGYDAEEELMRQFYGK